MASWLARALDVLRPHPGDTIMPGARVFPALGVQVLSGQVYAMDGTQLGALAGARAVAGGR